MNATGTPSILKQLLLILILLVVALPLYSHFKARYHVVVDTDGGIDDFRAICMMLASPDIEVIAITTVDGILSPEETAGKILSLLKHFGHEGIPVGVGKIMSAEQEALKEAGGLASEISWIPSGTDHSGNGSHSLSARTDVSALPGATGLILKSIALEEMPVDIVVMGPLTNLAAVMEQHPSVTEEVRKVYWHHSGSASDERNNGCDADAAGTILESTFHLVRIDAGEALLGDPATFISAPEALKETTSKNREYEGASREVPGGINTRYTLAVTEMYRTIPAGLYEKYLAYKPGDDCIPLFMLYPEKFSLKFEAAEPERISAVCNPGGELAATILEVLESDREDKSILFSRFPMDPALFEEDVAAIAEEVMKRHGLKEWKIVVLTNEFHEHLGAYSILGAKMGLRAREYFHVGIDEVTIQSLAGSTPPVSCMNDGLQVSTGATLGHGTITILRGDAMPAARFAFKERVVELTVRPEIRDRIQKEVRYGVETYGFETTGYWDYIRELALRYWLEFSRFEIFDIIEKTGAIASD